MSAWLDDAIVGALLLAAVAYAAARLGPKAWRKRILETLSQVITHAPAFLKLRGVAQRLEAASGKSQGACGGCDDCGSETPPAPQSSAELRVPVAKIGRRA